MARNVEFENENRYRNYPFSQDSTFLSENGVKLGENVFVDAILYPFGAKGRLYLSELNVDSRNLTINDDNGPVLHGKIVGSDKKIELLDNFGRHSGTIVCGTAGDECFSYGNLTFPSTALMFVTSVCVPLYTPGVTSLTIKDKKLDGSLLFYGKSSVFTPVASSGIVGNTSSLYFNAHRLGTSGSQSSGKTPIKKIYVVSEEGSIFRISSQSDNNVLVTIADMNRDDVCAHANANVIKDKTSDIDTCETEPECSHEPYDPTHRENPSEQCCVIDLESVGHNMVNIVADNTADYTNPLSIIARLGQPSPVIPVIKTNDPQDKREEEIKKITQDGFFGRGIQISIAGLENRG